MVARCYFCVIRGCSTIQQFLAYYRDCIFESLVAPSVYDATAEEILKILLSAFSSLISHLVEDQ